MEKLKIGVFGCGNMGRALVLAIGGKIPSIEFFLYNPNTLKAIDLAKGINAQVISNVEKMPIDLDWYIIAFKPQSLEDFSFPFSENAKLLSVLAGTKISKLQERFKIKKIARLMPNTPSSLGLGANLLFLNSEFNSIEERQLHNILNSTGKIFKIASEADLDLTTAFSGSGPALLFEIARIFEQELIKATDGRVPAKEIIAQTFLGTAMLMQSENSFEHLRNQVTSKKGVTEEALEVLTDKGLQGLFNMAFIAAQKRTAELSG